MGREAAASFFFVTNTNLTNLTNLFTIRLIRVIRVQLFCYYVFNHYFVCQ